MVEFRVSSSSKNWMESEFNPSMLELARMNDLLLANDRVMVRVKTGDMSSMRPAYALLTQVVDYFYFNMVQTAKNYIDGLKKDLEKKISMVEIRIRNGHRNYKLERETINTICEFQTIVYTLKGSLNLGLRFQSKMSRNDILDAALGITEEPPEEGEDDDSDVDEVTAGCETDDLPAKAFTVDDLGDEDEMDDEIKSD